MGNSFSTTTAAPATSNIQTLTGAREYVRDGARNAGSSEEYSDAQIDRVMHLLLTQVTHDFQLPKVTNAIQFVADTQSVDISSLVSAGFAPHHLLAAYITDSVPGYPPGLQRIDYEQLVEMINKDQAKGVPQFIAFPDSDTCYCYPMPDLTYNGRIRWFKQLTLWSPGADGDTVTLDIPQEVLLPVLRLGCPILLQAKEPEHMAGNMQNMPWYKEMKQTVVGIGNLGSRVSYRNQPSVTAFPDEV